MRERVQVTNPISSGPRLDVIASPTARIVEQRQSSGLRLAESLRSFAPSLDRFMGTIKQDYIADEESAADAAALQADVKSYSEAVSKGLIPASASPYYTRRFKQRVGRNAALDAYLKVQAEYNSSDVAGSTDPMAIREFLTGKVQEQLDLIQDPDERAGASPVLELMTNNLIQQHLANANRNLEYQNEVSIGDSISRSIDLEVTQAAEQGRDVDLTLLTELVHGIEAEAREQGFSGAKLNEVVARTIAAKIDEYELEDLADIALAKRPDGTPGAGTPANMRQLLENARDTVASTRLARENAEYTRQQRAEEELRKSILGNVGDQLLAAMEQGQDIRMTPAQIRQIANGDPELQEKLTEIVNTLTNFGEIEDTLTVSSIQDEVYSGRADVSYVVDAVSRGLISNPATIRDLLGEAKRNAEDRIFSRDEVQTAMSDVARLVGEFSEYGEPTNPEVAARARQLLRQELIKFNAQNPTATPLEISDFLDASMERVVRRLKPNSSFLSENQQQGTPSQQPSGTPEATRQGAVIPPSANPNWRQVPVFPDEKTLDAEWAKFKSGQPSLFDAWAAEAPQDLPELYQKQKQLLTTQK